MRDVPAAAVESAIRDRYGLRLTAPLRELTQGVHSRAWLAQTDRGPWVVKASDARSDPPAKVRAQAALSAFLNAHGVAAPELRETRAGGAVAEVAVAGQRYPLTLLRHEQLGRLDPATVCRAEVGKVAATVARMHAALEHYPGRAPIAADAAKSEREWGPQRVGAAGVLLASPLAPRFSADELAWLVAVDAAAEVALAAVPEPAGLTCAVLHGDLNFEHLRPLPDGRLYLFDFGDLCWGPVAHELAQLLQCLFRDSAISLHRWTELRGWLEAAYAAYGALRPADLAALPSFVVNRVVAQARYIVELAGAAPTPEQATAITRTYALAEQLLKDR